MKYDRIRGIDRSASRWPSQLGCPRTKSKKGVEPRAHLLQLLVHVHIRVFEGEVGTDGLHCFLPKAPIGQIRPARISDGLPHAVATITVTTFNVGMLLSPEEQVTWKLGPTYIVPLDT